ncbi:hypothetical protein [Paraburkholderia fynbosensis]|uniref:Uncharacterized protein n=1 Tax=Paraburkholderia fynbosensis TaxID=1200993 RepID=A0A6J5G7W7_9BURK|nr:hypothetical protein [Paraburkholderia fynbosensis]CAB3794814.1 hypothetical protein LMG27177_03757 [Paraburkholderia fynbosensis]
MLAIGPAATLSAYAASNAALPAPHHFAVDAASAQSDAVAQAARRYTAFWNTGDEACAKLTLSPAFIDRTLPDGRVLPYPSSSAFRSRIT